MTDNDPQYVNRDGDMGWYRLILAPSTYQSLTIFAHRLNGSNRA